MLINWRRCEMKTVRSSWEHLARDSHESIVVQEKSEMKTEQWSLSKNDTNFATKYQKTNHGGKKITNELSGIELQREQELAARKEDEFYLNQSKLRAAKRISEKRGLPLDFLYSVVRFPNELPDSASFPRPSVVINSLSKPEIDELANEIAMLRKIDLDYKDYWIAVATLLDSQMKTLANKQDIAGIHPSILPDIKALLEGKTTEELIKLELFIKQSLSGGDIRDDEYWHSVMKRLAVYKAQAKSDEYFNAMVKERLAALVSSGLPQVSANEIEKRFHANEMAKREVKVEAKEQSGAAKARDMRAKRVGRYTSDAELLRMEEDKGETEDEKRFTREVEVDENAVGRKPLYYARERIGIDWTTHNQHMYDIENTPPPTTLGYEFNIFYPDLLDKQQAPNYELLTTENPDLLILVFKSGAPYRDLAFKIVAQEWEYSQKKGYRCEFSNGIFHLHCWFKRFRYKR
jgi:hypothetical protein